MTSMSELVKDKEWQRVRAQLIGQWSSRPQWCCNQLKKFLGPLTKTTDKKLSIMMNYLTGSGFRMGKIKHSCITKIRSQVSMEMKKRKAKGIWSL